jgi:hypothetical protein
MIPVQNPAPIAARKCARCGKSEPEVSFVTRTVRRLYPGDAEPRVLTVLPTKCKGCTRAAQSAGRGKAEQEKRRKLPPEKRCTSCKKRLPRGTVYFAPHGTAADGSTLLSSRCRRCLAMKIGLYRKGKGYRAWRKDYLGRPEVVTRYKAHSKTRKRGKLPDAEERWKQTMRNRLTDTIERGDLVVPTVCELCGATRKLRADYPHGHKDHLAVAFLCYPCAYEMRDLRVRRKVGDRPDDDAAEWRELHRLNVTEAAARERSYTVRAGRANRYTSKKRRLLERRRIFLMVVCEHTRSQAKRIMDAEGWFKKGWPPLELILGRWLPYRPQLAGAALAVTERSRSRR